jgi:8-oxo-dGTP pyrophosphatase MutT (NUDIX family)
VKHSYGGVVIDLDGRVLLRVPAERRHGQMWTFAKGKAKGDESPERAALREVLEETGIRARLLAKIPGLFVGTKTRSEYFLMLPLEDTKQFDSETSMVRWVTREQAVSLISRTIKNGRRQRDLAVLKAAFEQFQARDFDPGMALDEFPPDAFAANLTPT